MPPDRAYIVEPVVSSDEAQEETIQDFAVIGDHNKTIEAFNRGYFDDFTVDSEGRWHYDYQEVEEESEYQESAFDKEEYIEAIYDSEPELESAIDWGFENLPQDKLDEYNRQVDSDNPEDVQNAVEWLIEQYQENTQYEETSTDAEYEDDEDEGPSLLTEDTQARIDELTDDEADVLNDTLDYLTEREPAGSDYAEQWEDYASQLYDSGNEGAAEVAGLTAKYHNGEVSAEEAIATAMNRWDLRELNQVYQHLSQYR